MLCSDKTGTLTLNKMVIQEQTPVYLQGETQYSLLRYAAMAARWKEPPRDALDTLVLNAVDMPSLDKVVQSDYMPFDPTVKRTEGTITLPSGETFKATKGAPHILLHLIDDEDIKKAVEHDVELLGERGIRCLAVARTAGNDMKQWVMLGLLTFLDPPRPDTKDTIEKAQALGVQVKMITGDHKLIAKETARVLGLGTEIGDATGLPMLLEGGKIPSDLMNYFPLIERGNGFAQVFPVRRTHTTQSRAVCVGASWQGASGAHTVLSLSDVSGAQVPDRGGPASRRLQDGHDGRWCQRRARTQEGRCRCRRAGACPTHRQAMAPSVQRIDVRYVLCGASRARRTLPVLLLTSC